jgi:ribosome-binding protein aMBF1 (putative translation factor)
MSTNWKQEQKNLGVETDIVIAERLGVSRERVRQKRAELKIGRAPRQLGRPDREVGTTDVMSCLTAVPLSATDRQLLTDARIAKGWSQTELAERAGGSLGFVHAIEAGKKSPSPEFLTQLCKALGLTWECEINLRIFATDQRGQKTRR